VLVTNPPIPIAILSCKQKCVSSISEVVDETRAV
jgi:hypothetical protein